MNKFYLHEDDFGKKPIVDQSLSTEAELTQIQYKLRAKRDNSGVCPFAESQ